MNRKRMTILLVSPSDVNEPQNCRSSPKSLTEIEVVLVLHLGNLIDSVRRNGFSNADLRAKTAGMLEAIANTYSVAESNELIGNSEPRKVSECGQRIQELVFQMIELIYGYSLQVDFTST